MEKKKLNRIKAVLAEQDVTAVELAKALNKSNVSISRWCTNESQPSLESLFEIANYLQVSVKELLVDNQNH
ncbi:MAG: helix-turn-helix transcriptional regulator [Bacteroidota bacterium]